MKSRGQRSGRSTPSEYPEPSNMGSQRRRGESRTKFQQTRGVPQSQLRQGKVIKVMEIHHAARDASEAHSEA